MNKKITDSISYLEETTSTNQYLKDLCQVEKLHEGFTVHAEFQKSGRGCAGNSWESQKGKNILFSTLLYPDFLSANHQFILSEITALSILDALKDKVKRNGNIQAASEFSIKWPNDIFWKNKKIAGILVENMISGNKIIKTIVGAGINVNQTSFSDDIPNPISLKQILGYSTEKEILFALILHNLHMYYLRIMKNEGQIIHQEYMNNLYRKSGLHAYFSDNDGYFNAYIKDVDPMGALLLETESGKKKSFLFKDVIFV